jgi:hypothetical protein
MNRGRAVQVGGNETALLDRDRGVVKEWNKGCLTESRDLTRYVSYNLAHSWNR